MVLRYAGVVLAQFIQNLAGSDTPPPHFSGFESNQGPRTFMPTACKRLARRSVRHGPALCPRRRARSHGLPLGACQRCRVDPRAPALPARRHAARASHTTTYILHCIANRAPAPSHARSIALPDGCGVGNSPLPQLRARCGTSRFMSFMRIAALGP